MDRKTGLHKCRHQEKGSTNHSERVLLYTFYRLWLELASRVVEPQNSSGVHT